MNGSQLQNIKKSIIIASQVRHKINYPLRTLSHLKRYKSSRTRINNKQLISENNIEPSKILLKNIEPIDLDCKITDLNFRTVYKQPALKNWKKYKDAIKKLNSYYISSNVVNDNNQTPPKEFITISMQSNIVKNFKDQINFNRSYNYLKQSNKISTCHMTTSSSYGKIPSVNGSNSSNNLIKTNKSKQKSSGYYCPKPFCPIHHGPPPKVYVKRIPSLQSRKELPKSPLTPLISLPKKSKWYQYKYTKVVSPSKTNEIKITDSFTESIIKNTIKKNKPINSNTGENFTSFLFTSDIKTKYRMEPQFEKFSYHIENDSNRNDTIKKFVNETGMKAFVSNPCSKIENNTKIIPLINVNDKIHNLENKTIETSLIDTKNNISHDTKSKLVLGKNQTNANEHFKTNYNTAHNFCYNTPMGNTIVENNIQENVPKSGIVLDMKVYPNNINYGLMTNTTDQTTTYKNIQKSEKPLIAKNSENLFPNANNDVLTSTATDNNVQENIQKPPILAFETYHNTTVSNINYEPPINATSQKNIHETTTNEQTKTHEARNEPHENIKELVTNHNVNLLTTNTEAKGIHSNININNDNNYNEPIAYLSVSDKSNKDNERLDITSSIGIDPSTASSSINRHSQHTLYYNESNGYSAAETNTITNKVIQTLDTTSTEIDQNNTSINSDVPIINNPIENTNISNNINPDASAMNTTVIETYSSITPDNNNHYNDLNAHSITSNRSNDIINYNIPSTNSPIENKNVPNIFNSNAPTINTTVIESYSHITPNNNTNYNELNISSIDSNTPNEIIQKSDTPSNIGIHQNTTSNNINCTEPIINSTIVNSNAETTQKLDVPSNVENYPNITPNNYKESINNNNLQNINKDIQTTTISASITSCNQYPQNNSNYDKPPENNSALTSSYVNVENSETNTNMELHKNIPVDVIHDFSTLNTSETSTNHENIPKADVSLNTDSSQQFTSSNFYGTNIKNLETPTSVETYQTTSSNNFTHDASTIVDVKKSYPYVAPNSLNQNVSTAETTALKPTQGHIQIYKTLEITEADQKTTLNSFNKYDEMSVNNTDHTKFHEDLKNSENLAVSEANSVDYTLDNINKSENPSCTQTYQKAPIHNNEILNVSTLTIENQQQISAKENNPETISHQIHLPHCINNPPSTTVPQNHSSENISNSLKCSNNSISEIKNHPNNIPHAINSSESTINTICFKNSFKSLKPSSDMENHQNNTTLKINCTESHTNNIVSTNYSEKNSKMAVDMEVYQSNCHHNVPFSALNTNDKVQNNYESVPNCLNIPDETNYSESYNYSKKCTDCSKIVSGMEPYQSQIFDHSALSTCIAPKNNIDDKIQKYSKATSNILTSQNNTQHGEKSSMVSFPNSTNYGVPTVFFTCRNTPENIKQLDMSTITETYQKLSGTDSSTSSSEIQNKVHKNSTKCTKCSGTAWVVGNKLNNNIQTINKDNTRENIHIPDMSIKVTYPNNDTKNIHSHNSIKSVNNILSRKNSNENIEKSETTISVQEGIINPVNSTNNNNTIENSQIQTNVDNTKLSGTAKKFKKTIASDIMEDKSNISTKANIKKIGKDIFTTNSNSVTNVANTKTQKIYEFPKKPYNTPVKEIRSIATKKIDSMLRKLSPIILQNQNINNSNETISNIKTEKKNNSIQKTDKALENETFIDEEEKRVLKNFIKKILDYNSTKNIVDHLTNDNTKSNKANIHDNFNPSNSGTKTINKNLKSDITLKDSIDVTQTSDTFVDSETTNKTTMNEKIKIIFNDVQTFDNNEIDSRIENLINAEIKNNDTNIKQKNYVDSKDKDSMKTENTTLINENIKSKSRILNCDKINKKTICHNIIDNNILINDTNLQKTKSSNTQSQEGDNAWITDINNHDRRKSYRLLLPRKALRKASSRKTLTNPYLRKLIKINLANLKTLNSKKIIPKDQILSHKLIPNIENNNPSSPKLANNSELKLKSEVVTLEKSYEELSGSNRNNTYLPNVQNVASILIKRTIEPQYKKPKSRNINEEFERQKSLEKSEDNAKKYTIKTLTQDTILKKFEGEQKNTTLFNELMLKQTPMKDERATYAKVTSTKEISTEVTPKQKTNHSKIEKAEAQNQIDNKKTPLLVDAQSEIDKSQISLIKSSELKENNHKTEHNKYETQNKGVDVFITKRKKKRKIEDVQTQNNVNTKINIFQNTKIKDNSLHAEFEKNHLTKENQISLNGDFSSAEVSSKLGKNNLKTGHVKYRSQFEMDQTSYKITQLPNTGFHRCQDTTSSPSSTKPCISANTNAIAQTMEIDESKITTKNHHSILAYPCNCKKLIKTKKSMRTDLRSTDKTKEKHSVTSQTLTIDKDWNKKDVDASTEGTSQLLVSKNPKTNVILVQEHFTSPNKEKLAKYTILNTKKTPTGKSEIYTITQEQKKCKCGKSNQKVDITSYNNSYNNITNQQEINERRSKHKIRKEPAKLKTYEDKNIATDDNLFRLKSICYVNLNTKKRTRPKNTCLCKVKRKSSTKDITKKHKKYLKDRTDFFKERILNINLDLVRRSLHTYTNLMNLKYNNNKSIFIEKSGMKHNENIFESQQIISKQADKNQIKNTTFIVNGLEIFKRLFKEIRNFFNSISKLNELNENILKQNIGRVQNYKKDTCILANKSELKFHNDNISGTSLSSSTYLSPNVDYTKRIYQSGKKIRYVCARKK